MLSYCPRKVIGSEMTHPESSKWCEKHRDASRCFDCPLFPHEENDCSGDDVALDIGKPQPLF